MKSNQIMFYNTTVNEALEMFEMESRRDDYGYVNMDKVKVKINKKGDHVLITLDKYDFNVDLEDSIIELKMAFPGKFRDLDSIERVQAVLSLQPKNNWWKEILEGLQSGEPLHYRVGEILEELEERIENPDQEIKEKLEQAIASNPRNNLLRSFQDQFLAGRELSDRQMEILEENLPRQVSRPSLAVNVDQRQLDRVNEALSLNSRDRFVQQMKQKVEQGIRLSPKQMAVVENSILTSKSPAARLLNDLRGNVSLSKEDFKTIMKGINRGIDILNEEERKRIRHLIYRNQRRLDNSYSKDEIRTLLKKGSLMRRSASEIIKNLESRIARLEKQAGPGAGVTLCLHGDHDRIRCLDSYVDHDYLRTTIDRNGFPVFKGFATIEDLTIASYYHSSHIRGEAAKITGKDLTGVFNSDIEDVVQDVENRDMSEVVEITIHGIFLENSVEGAGWTRSDAPDQISITGQAEIEIEFEDGETSFELYEFESYADTTNLFKGHWDTLDEEEEDGNH